MSKLSNMPFAGVAVIVIIAALFILSVILLFSVYLRYKRLTAQIRGGAEQKNSFMKFIVNDFADGYRRYGAEVNTPAIITNAVKTKLSSALLVERFLNNAVSLFVTLGLFGTFLGLSLSVSSLTELISYSNTSEWLSVLDSVGDGLMSALSGMGVAFYTSLAGVACAIILTVLRTIFNLQSERETLETRLELWLDHSIAPMLPTDNVKSDAELVHQMINGLNAAAAAMDKTLKDSTAAMQKTSDNANLQLNAFNKTVGSFNEGVRDFSEFNYNLRGTVERMDVAARDLVSVMREASRNLERRTDDR